MTTLLMIYDGSHTSGREDVANPTHADRRDVHARALLRTIHLGSLVCLHRFQCPRLFRTTAQSRKNDEFTGPKITRAYYLYSVVLYYTISNNTRALCSVTSRRASRRELSMMCDSSARSKIQRQTIGSIALTQNRSGANETS